MSHFPGKIILSLLIFLHLANLAILAVSQEPNFHLCVVENGNFTPESTYQKNRYDLLNSIYTNTEIQYGFYNFSNGLDTDTVYAIALCRGDIQPETCRSCIKTAGENLTSLCPEQKEAIIGFDDCILRYANRYIFGIMENAPYFFVHTDTNVSDPTGFVQMLKSLFGRLRLQAAAGNSRMKCATGEELNSSFPPVYALLQCTPDLSEKECDDCLYNATERINQCCEARQGGRVYYPSCSFWYEISPFYGSLIEAGAPPSPATDIPAVTVGKKSSSWKTLIKIVVPITVIVMFVIGVAVVLTVRRRRNKEILGVPKNSDENENEEDDGDFEDSLQFNFSIIKVATDNFSDVKKLGHGGFGAVYKGVLHDGREIAVKRLAKESKQGQYEFMNEMKLLAKLQHRNLVRLLGFCLEGEERLLVYELLPNSSLDKYIYASDGKNLDWETRNKIIGGIARGLLYLHEDSRLRIIHLDLKASNILLDANLNPKISDFGMARFFAQDQSHERASRIAGTFGYIAPEYMSSRHVSTKSDVFSFGVLVLEIAIGKKNSALGNEEEVMNIQTHAWENWKEGKASNLINPDFGEKWASEIIRCIHIGLLCVQENAADRPTMSIVVGALNSQAIPLNEPLKPGFYTRRSEPSVTSSDSAVEVNLENSVDHASITHVYAR